MFLDNTACNLASLNLMKFYKEPQEKGARPQFDVAAYIYALRLWTLTLEISVAMSQLPSKEIAEGTYKYRTLGLGYANISRLLMASDIPYDSKEARALVVALSAIMTGISYKTSAEMAKELGVFEGFADNREHMLRVIRNHRHAAYSQKEGYESLEIKPVPLDEENSNRCCTICQNEHWALP